MKVIHVPRRFTVNAWGGTESVVLSTAARQVQAGFEAKIYTTKALDSRRDEMVEGVPVRRYNYTYPFFGLSKQQIDTMDNVGGNVLSLPLLSALLREPDVDLLHAHSGKRLGGMVRTVARIKKIPYLLTLHGGQFDVPVAESDRHLAPIEGKLEWGKAFGALLGARKVLEDADAVICVSEGEAALVRQQHPNLRVEYLPNGVDVAAFQYPDRELFRNSFNIPDNRRLILCVGRIDPQKNQLVLIDALPAILRDQPDAHLVLVGPVTNHSYLAALENRVKQLVLENHVTIVKGIAQADPLFKSAFHSAELFCLPSIHEPFGMVILEAWASKLPVLSARVGGVPGFTSHGADSWLLNSNDSSHWSREIISLFSQPCKAGQLARNGYRKVAAQYDWSRVTARLQTIYDEVRK